MSTHCGTGACGECDDCMGEVPSPAVGRTAQPREMAAQVDQLVARVLTLEGKVRDLERSDSWHRTQSDAAAMGEEIAKLVAERDQERTVRMAAVEAIATARLAAGAAEGESLMVAVSRLAGRPPVSPCPRPGNCLSCGPSTPRTGEACVHHVTTGCVIWPGLTCAPHACSRWEIRR